MRTLLAVVLLVAVAVPARAEVTWIPAGGHYELTGAMLFRLRAEMPDDLEEKLKPIRNVVFADEIAFGTELESLGIDGEWLTRLINLAATPGGTFGIESRGPDMTTLYVEGAEPALDDNAFTSKSWLRSLPELAGNTVTTTMSENCLEVVEGNVSLLSLCDPETGDDGTAVMLKTEATHVVGIGQEFQVPGSTEVERVGFVRHGFNAMEGFNGGANGNTLIPIAYFDHPQRDFALILDNRYRQEWDLTSAEAYRLRVGGGDFRLHLITGDTFADIRRRFMGMSGHPPVPPKAMFGLWISEYGYESWDEVESVLQGLDNDGFPVAGVVLDLFWFGGIEKNSSTSRMGSLRWDTEEFRNPAAKIAELKSRGIGVMTIEESYISAGLPEFEALAAENALAHDANGAPLIVNENGNWWGRGGMIDWTPVSARAFWHDFRRQALIEDGVIGHWTDLGEPEMINPGFLYGDGLTDAQVRNSYNVLWLEGIADGYARLSPEKRPFMMSRSGGMGMQALGASMWSGDTGSDYGSLAAQMPQQTHMMWSGVDYYGSDVGGFHRGALGTYPGTHDEAMNELYTQWLAYSAMFEVPVRPHTENLCNCKQTAPNRIGHLESNSENVLLRQSLTPYYYSLAFEAWLSGEPLFPSLSYWYPDDEAADRFGHVKMIGPQFVAAAAATNGARSVEVYLPEGTWHDFHTLERVASTGETLTRPLVNANGHYVLPLFIRDGGIVPLATDATTRVLAVVGTAANSFDWYDDDGETTAYQRGDYDQVRIVLEGTTLTLTRERGSRLAPSLLSWAGLTEPVRLVLVNGVETAFDTSSFGVRVNLPPFEKTLKIELVK